MQQPFRDMRLALKEKEPHKRPDYVGIGQMLHDTRVSFNISVEQAANDLKIKKSYIHALEAGQLEKIPGIVYAKGYLRMYADYLKINLDTMLTLVRPSTPVKDLPHSYTPMQEPRRLRQAVFVSLAIMAMLGVLWNLSIKKTEEAPIKIIRPVPPASSFGATNAAAAMRAAPDCFNEEIAIYPACYAAKKIPSEGSEHALPTLLKLPLYFPYFMGWRL